MCIHMIENLLAWKANIASNWILVYQISKILPYAIFRSGTNLLSWAVAKIDA